MIAPALKSTGRAAAVLLIMLGAATPAAGQATAYGMVTHDLDQIRAEKMTELGAGFARVSFRWWQIEPTRGSYNWATMDEYVSNAAARGIRLFASLGEPPEWAGGGTAHNGHPQDLQDWYNFVFAAVSRYRDYIDHWGIWNEPNLTQFLTDRGRYEEIVHTARAAIKDADASALVLGPEVSEHALDDGWFANVMSRFGSTAFDIVTVHIYTGNLADRMDRQVYPWRYGKPVWLTEIGLESIPGNSTRETLQRNFYSSVLQHFEPRRWWWTKIFFYDIWAWDNGSRFGICRPDWSNTPAFDFYRDWIATHPPHEAPSDRDGDGLDDRWEGHYGLSLDSGAGHDGPSGDPDGDGRTNSEELAAGTHPRGFFQQYLAEGASSAFFDMRLALLNPHDSTHASVQVRFAKTDGTVRAETFTLAPRARRTIDMSSVPGFQTAEFATTVEADTAVVVDRLMRWDARAYGSHAETGVARPSTTWFVAEGATHSRFELFYLLQNPNDHDVVVQVRYLLPPPATPLVKSYVVRARRRFNIWVNHEDPRLASAEVSASFLADAPILVERAMYLNSGGLSFGAGSDSAAVTQPAPEWFLAEGATGPYFDLFVLIANPNDIVSEVTATYLRLNGTPIEKTYSIPPRSRFTIWVDQEDPGLADTAVSTVVRSTNGVPVVVERAMWWPGPTAATWFEAHTSVGATGTGTRWGLAEGEVGGPNNASTFILVANTADYPASIRIRLVFEDGSTDTHLRTVAPRSRFNFDVGAASTWASNRRFGAIVESLPFLARPAAAIVVERALYSDSGGVRWAAGSNALATKLQ